MAQRFRRLRLAAVNLDGVLLNDSFGPVIHHFVSSRGGAYTIDVERRILSQPRRLAGRELADAAGLSVTGAEALDLYFAERAAYVEAHPVRLVDGALDLVARLRGLGLRTICYGGLGASHFEDFLGGHRELFDEPGYVCTDGFRPGIREITTEIFGLRYDEAVFIDDVARVAEEALALDVPFIGHPSTHPHSFQAELMREAGVRHIAGSLDAIDAAMLHAVDAEALSGPGRRV